MNLVGRLTGSRDALIKRLEGFVGAAVLRAEVLEGGTQLLDEMKARVPRETGELEGEIAVRNVFSGRGMFVAGVGVPRSSPAIHKAWATEYGTWNYTVGDPGSPKTRWPAKSKSGATMPWARQSVLVRKNAIKRRWRQSLARRLRRR